MTPTGAYIRQPSGLRLNVLDPKPDEWTDEDLAIGLSRTFRWGGHSVWPLPLSVAQHSLTVLALAKQLSTTELTAVDCLRQLTHDADETLIGGFDPISPLKPFLGRGYQDISEKLQHAVAARYGLGSWSALAYKLHKHADVLAAASEAVHVAGWTIAEVRDLLGICLAPLHGDPLAELYEDQPWAPWAPDVAAERFLAELRRFQDEKQKFLASNLGL